MMTINNTVENCTIREVETSNSISSQFDFEGYDGSIFSIELLSHIIKQLNITVRFNQVSHLTEISIPNYSYWDMLEQDLPILLNDALTKHKIEKVSKGAITDALQVIANRNRYNPVEELLQSASWDGKSRFSELIQILNIPTDDELSHLLLYKWMWQCLSLSRNSRVDPYGADGILVLQGPQGIGKTTFAKRVAVKPSLFKMSQKVSVSNKDTLLEATGAWICELAEIESSVKASCEDFKAFVTADVDRLRPPYGHSSFQYARLTSFIGTCNNTYYLKDATGSRRFWTIPLSEINLKELEAFDFLQLWLEIDQETRLNPQGFRLTPEEAQLLAERNLDYAEPIPGENKVREILCSIDTNTEYREMSVSEFIYLHPELSGFTSTQVGKALDLIGKYPSRLINIRDAFGNRTSKRVRMLPVFETSKQIA